MSRVVRITRSLAAVLVALSPLAPALANPEATTLEELFGTDRWRLVSMTFEGRTHEIEPEAEAEFLVNELGNLAGTVGCNRLMAAAMLTADGDVTFLPLASTMMACPEPAMGRENAFVRAIEYVQRYEATDGQVRFTGPDVELVFELAEEPKG